MTTANPQICLDIYDLKVQNPNFIISQNDIKSTEEGVLNLIKNSMFAHPFLMKTSSDQFIDIDEHVQCIKVNVSIDFLQHFPINYDKISLGYFLLTSMDYQPCKSQIKWIDDDILKQQSKKLNTPINKKIQITVNSGISPQYIYFLVRCQKDNPDKPTYKCFFSVHKIEANKKIDPKLLDITEDEVTEAQQKWGEGIVRMGQLKYQREELEKYTNKFLKDLYAFDIKKAVLFKPTKVSEVTFRTNKESALSYFIGGNSKYSEDKGFAINPWTKVEFQNAAIINENQRAMAMGNYYFTDLSGDITKVDYTFGYMRDDNGDLKIDVHHSSLPFVENDNNCKKCKGDSTHGQHLHKQQSQNSNEGNQYKNNKTKLKKINNHQSSIKFGVGQYRLPLYDLENFQGFYNSVTSYGTNTTIFIECQETDIPKKLKYNELQYGCQSIHLNNNPYECAQEYENHQ